MTSASTFTIPFEKYTLDNGLDVVLHEDHSDPIVAVAILYNVGSNREKPGKTGFAHFFEHMLFQNSENVGKGNFFKKIEEMGGTLNGGTWRDGTIYYEVVPRDGLERVLWLESDRMGFMINTVTRSVFENEKLVVKNEKRQRVDNLPYGHTDYVIDKALYAEDHPYNWQVIGSLQDLENSTIDDVRDFYGRWYGPENATLVIAGDFDQDQTRHWIEKYFGELKPKNGTTVTPARKGQLQKTKKLYHEDNFAELPELTLVWPTVEDRHPDSYALSYLAHLLTVGKRAPAFKIVVQERQLAPRTAASHRAGEVAGSFWIKVRANAGTDLDEVHEALFDAMEMLETRGIDARDMQRIKNTLESDFYNGIESVLAKSFQLAIYNELAGNPALLSKEIEKILAVTDEDVLEVYRRYIKGKPYVGTSFVPQGKKQLVLTGSERAEIVEEEPAGATPEPDVQDEPTGFQKSHSAIDRTIEPALGDPPLLKRPEIFHHLYRNGLSSFCIEHDEIPMVNFSFLVRGGLYLEDPEKVGVSSLLSALMMEGTRQKTPEQLEDEIGQLGASVSMDAHKEFIQIEVNCLSKHFHKMLAIVEEMLLEPRWDETEFSRLKKRAVADITQKKAQPAYRAIHSINKLLYGHRHILCHDTAGTVESVSHMDIKDLKTHYQQYFKPSQSSFQAVGDVSNEVVRESLGNLQDAWKDAPVTIPRYETAPADSEPVYFIDVPNAKQSVITFGQHCPPTHHPDFFALKFINYRLGGSFRSRLNHALREEKGYTYGASSAFGRSIFGGLFLGSTSVHSAVTRESLEICRNIIDSYPASFDEHDLTLTRTVLIKKNALAFETLSQKMKMLEMVSGYKLPLDFLKQEEEIILQMDIERARDLIASYLDPAKFVYVIAGDAKTQLKNVESLLPDKVVLLEQS